MTQATTKFIAACAVLAGASGLFLSQAAVAQTAATYPAKPIRLVVPFTPGGSTDILARAIGQKLNEAWGQPVVIENVPGAGGSIGADKVAKAPADGYTLLMGHIGTLAVNPSLYPNLPYDPIKSFAPVAWVARVPNVLVVHPGTGIKTFAEFIAAAKKNPGKLDFASTGPGSASHLAGELLNDMAKLDTLHVPYKGGAAALQDLLGGRVAAWYATMATAAPHIEAGKIIPLASTGTQRLGALPHIPTIAESGYPGFNATNWYAFVASSKVPKPVLDRWNTELVKVLTASDVVEQLNKHGLTPMPGSRDELARYMVSETATWGRIIRERKITSP